MNYSNIFTMLLNHFKMKTVYPDPGSQRQLSAPSCPMFPCLLLSMIDIVASSPRTSWQVEGLQLSSRKELAHATGQAAAAACTMPENKPGQIANARSFIDNELRALSWCGSMVNVARHIPTQAVNFAFRDKSRVVWSRGPSVCVTLQRTWHLVLLLGPHPCS